MNEEARNEQARKYELYKDPVNYKTILNQLSETSVEDTETLIKETFPTWLVYWIPSYSSDYSHLQKNWETMCKLSGKTPKFIVLVDWISFDEEHKLIEAFANRMTYHGYVVRRREEFGTCPVCDRGLPCEQLYNFMVSKKLPVPERWSAKCKNCL